MKIFKRFLGKQKREEKKEILKKWLETDYTQGLPMGYSNIFDNAEVKICVDVIADLVSMMTIKLYENTENGDKRIKNTLSRLIDVTPNKRLSRKNLIYLIARDLILYGNSYAIVRFKDDFIDEIVPVSNSEVRQEQDFYNIGGKVFKNDEILHFMTHPQLTDNTKGQGLQVFLKDVLKSIKVTNETKYNFMANKFNPSVIIKVDAYDDVFASEEGQKKLKEKYLSAVNSGAPFFVPSELFEITTIKPLTLNDIALADNVSMDKKTVANLLGVPLFYLGLEPYNKETHHAFITSTVMFIAKAIEQELTTKLLYAPTLYFKMSAWSLYQYDLQTLATIGADLKTRGLMTGNEVRRWLDLDPLEELDELTILENYIPVSKVGDQNKLKGGEKDGD